MQHSSAKPESGTAPPLNRLVARIPHSLWRQVRYHSLDTGLSATRITQKALEEYLRAQAAEAVKP